MDINHEGEYLMTVLLLVGVLLGAEPDPKVPVALIDTAKGATVERGSAKFTAAAAGLLLPGDKVTAGDKGELTAILLTDGRRLRLKPGKTATVGEKGFDPADAAEEVVGPRPDPALLKLLREAYKGRIPGGAATTVIRGGDTNANDSEKARGVTPLLGTRILTDHPTLAWPAVSGVKEYRVQLYPGLAGAPRPLWSATTREPQLAYPEEEKVLKPGAMFRWQVTAVREGGKEEIIVEAKFFTTSEPEAERWVKVRRLAEGDDPAGWLVAADAYDATGVYGKALPLYEKLALRAPDGANYQLALAAYYTRAGRDADAKKAKERAKELGANIGE